MKRVWNNPEIVRNARMQLRPGRIIAAVIVCLAISGTIWESIVHSDVAVSFGGLHKAGAVFAFTLNLQIAVLLIGGGILVLQSVRREKDLNTFDFQRLTRLSASELAVGKLFGAPVGAYFVTLCFWPVALIAAIRGQIPGWTVTEAYAILLLGCIAFHSLALLISVVERRDAGVIGILLYLAVLGVTLADSRMNSMIGRVNPFVAGGLLGPRWTDFSFKDSFFGIALPHFAVLMVLYLAFSTWFLLAAIRNIKREPSLYEVYSPVEAFGFALFLGLLLIGFYPWQANFYQGIVRINVPDFVLGAIRRVATPTQQAEQYLLGWIILLFAGMALVLLRNRERARRRLTIASSTAKVWWMALWPAPYIMLGVGLMGGSVIALIAHYRYEGEAWSLPLAVYDVAFAAVWLSRDAICLQWLNLRRAKMPLASAALYYLIFYGCTGTVFSALFLYAVPRSAALTAMLLPSPLFALNESNWGPAQKIWLAALLAQAIQVIFFWWLQQRRLLEFSQGKGSPTVLEQARLQNA